MRIPTLLMTLAASVAAASPALAASDASFMRTAIQGDNSEMRLGQIAAQRGASQGVRAFGQMLMQDHSTGRQQALPVAQALGVAPTDAMAPAARQEERRLSRLNGYAFDREFVRYMVNDHRQDIADFRREARTARSPVRQFAEQTLPVLQKHLQTALDLQHGGRR